MAAVKTLGLILHKTNVGETDRILTILTPALGKKRVVVKAVRKPLSKLAGHLDTFMLSQLILSDDENLPTVTGAVLIEPFEYVRSSFLATNQAFAVSRLIERVILENLPQQRLFQLTLDALARIDSQANWQSTWLYFLNELSHVLGVSVSNFHCFSCGLPIRTKNVWWVSEDRHFFCQDHYLEAGSGGRQMELSVVKLLHLLQTKPFTMIQTVRYPNLVARKTEELFLREITQWLNKPWQYYSGL